jgi:hypothetical protein
MSWPFGNDRRTTTVTSPNCWAGKPELTAAAVLTPVSSSVQRPPDRVGGTLRATNVFAAARRRPKHGRHYRRRERNLACAGDSAQNGPVPDRFAPTGNEFPLAACARVARLSRLDASVDVTEAPNKPRCDVFTRATCLASPHIAVPPNGGSPRYPRNRTIRRLNDTLLFRQVLSGVARRA